MRLAQQNIAEAWEADGKLTVPIGTIAYHLESKKTCAAGSKLKRADCHGRLLVCRERFTLQLREVPVALRRGQAGTSVHVVWCSIELASDPAVLAGELPGEETPLRFEQLEERLRTQVHDSLQSHAEEHDLTTRPGQIEIRARILPEIHVPGFEVKAFTFRRVLTQEEYTDEKRVWAEFQSGLKRVIQDETLADAARTGELEKALDAIENDNIRALLTEQEKTLAAAARLTKYVDLFPPQQPAQAEQSPQPCPHLHCRVDLSIGQTFDCQRCGNKLHVWHRSAKNPAVCDQCYAAMAARRCWLIAAAAILLLVPLGVLAARARIPERQPQLEKPLALNWYGFGQRFEDDGWREFQVHDGMTMYSGDQFRIVFSPSDDCYVYLVNVAPDGGVSQLFPNPAVNLQNPCRRNHKYEVPDGINWFTLDERTGLETLFLVASIGPLLQLESVLENAADGSTSGKPGQEVHRIMGKIEEQTRPETASKVHTRSGIRTRAVLIQADHRLGPPQFKAPQRAEAMQKAITGLGTAVQRIQISHLPPPSRSRSHD